MVEKSKKSCRHESVVILGSGLSISSLTKAEKDFVSNSHAVVAMNKFMAFYKEAGIYPTHVYFHDLHDNSQRFLKYIFDVCINDKISNIRFIVSDQLRERLASSRFQWVENWVSNKRPFLSALTKLRNPRTNLKRIFAPFGQMRVPDKCDFDYVAVADWLKGGPWAETLNEPLYHFRGSLTSVLNYASICFPGRDIYLVGTDFGSDRYFFEQSLQDLPFEWKDWTFDLVKEKKIHFSAQTYEGTTMFDVFPFIQQALRASGNRVFCSNADSLLVTRGLVEFKPLPCISD